VLCPYVYVCLSPQGLVQYVLLWGAVQKIQMQPRVGNTFHWGWNAARVYSTSSTYKMLCFCFVNSRGTNNWCTDELQLFSFGWLCSIDQCATCSFSLQEDEMTAHILTQCSFSRKEFFPPLSFAIY
jgi:hypothetical protein